MSLGARINRLRMKSGRSLQQLADDVEVSKAHIYELESGKVKNPSVEVLKKLARLFDVPVTFFIEEDDEVEFHVMFRDLEKTVASLSKEDRETIELMAEVLRKKAENQNGH